MTGNRNLRGPHDIARTIAERRGWPILDPLKVVPVQSPQRYSEPVPVRVPEEVYLSPVAERPKQTKTVMNALIWGAKLVRDVAAVIGIAAVMIVTVPAGAVTAIASTIGLPIEITYGYLSGELRILNTLPHFKNLPTSLSTFVLGTGMAMPCIYLFQLVETNSFSKKEFLQTTEKFLKESAKIAAQAVVYSALTIGLIANVAHCVETGFFSTAGLAMLLIASIGHGMLNFMKNRDQGKLEQQIAKAASRVVTALEITIGTTVAVEMGIGFIQHNIEALMYSILIAIPLLTIGFADIALRNSLKSNHKKLR